MAALVSADDRFVRVEGTVRIGGVPVERGSISFVPLVAVGRNAVTTEITEGRYLAENVPVGNVRAVITATKETGNMVRYFDKSMPETIELVPLRLRSGIDLEINASSTITTSTSRTNDQASRFPAQCFL